MQKTTVKSWYVLYTKPRWEKKIAQRLTDLGIECYCPLNKVERNWSDRKKIIHEPLFSCYLFVRLTADKLTIPLNINGVLNYVNRMKKPANVRNEEIDSIKMFLSEYDHVHLEKINVGRNDAIEIISGPFMEQQGYITDVRANYVKVAIYSLGYSLVATVPRTGIRKLENYDAGKLHEQHLTQSKQQFDAVKQN